MILWYAFFIKRPVEASHSSNPQEVLALSGPETFRMRKWILDISLF